MKDKVYKGMDADPELPDEDDPAFKAEQFETMKSMGWKPESLTDPEDAKEYAEWLEKNP